MTQDAKAFAETQMGLKKTRNYLTYVQLDQNYVSALVTGSAKCKIDPYTWDFPIVGRVPYLGYATLDRARNEAKKLEAQNLDSFVRDTVAFSTLGWFDDPVLSSMLRLDEFDLINTIIHETIHATIFIKNSADFNEALATFWAQKGTEEFFISKHGTDSNVLKNARDDSHDTKIFSEFITQQITDINKWYESQNSSCDLAERAQMLQGIQDKFNQLIKPKLKTKSYSGFGQGPMNNARLAAFKTYYYDFSVFEKAWDKAGKNHQKFLEQIKLLENSASPFADLKEKFDK